MLKDSEKLEQIEQVINWALKDSAFLYVNIMEQLRHGLESSQNSDKETLKEIEKIIDQPRFSQSLTSKQEIQEILEGLQGSVEED